MSARFAENLYLTTGKVSMRGAATAMKCMRKLVAFWRKRKAERAAARMAGGAGEPAPNESGTPVPPDVLLPGNRSKKMAFADGALAA